MDSRAVQGPDPPDQQNPKPPDGLAGQLGPGFLGQVREAGGQGALPREPQLPPK